MQVIFKGLCTVEFNQIEKILNNSKISTQYVLSTRSLNICPMLA